MFNIILVLMGTFFLAYSTYLCKSLNLNKKIDRDIFNKPCFVIAALIYLFIFGYLVFLFYLFRHQNSNSPEDLIVSVVFFLGAVFVVIVLKVNNRLILALTEKSINLQKLNDDLNVKNQELIKKSKALIISEDKYKKQTEELEKTLEDFYTMRIGMEKQMKQGTLEEENRKIKQRFDALKSE